MIYIRAMTLREMTNKIVRRVLMMNSVGTVLKDILVSIVSTVRDGAGEGEGVDGTQP